MKLAIIIPVLNDWASLRVLAPQLAAILARLEVPATIIAVDDGSTETPGEPPPATAGILEYQILRLGSNLGHQRAIVVGLAHVHQQLQVDAVVVMDADGEDRPEDLPKLLAAAKESPGAIISARRARRSEGWIFRCGYAGYKALHRCLTGKFVQGGNYSLVPAARLAGLLHCGAIWQHYAAGILASRLPVIAVDTDRGHRIDGTSRMNLVSLIVHGVTAISVFDRIAFVRLLLACLGGMSVAGAGVVAAVAIRLFTDYAIPGWATYTTGLLGILFLQLSTLSILLVGMLLQARNSTPFVPIADAHRYAAAVTPWCESAD